MYKAQPTKTHRAIIAGCMIGAAFLPVTGYSFEEGSWIFRAGASNVSPDVSSDQLKLNGSSQAFVNAVGPAELDVDDNTQLGLTVEYMFTPNWGLEVLAATPFEHTASGTGALSGLNVANVKHLPPTISAVYHFSQGSVFRPYVGAGINYTYFFDENLTGAADSAFESLGLSGGDVNLDDSWGVALQLGGDYHISGNWWLNASVRWIQLGTTAEVTFDDGTRVSGDLDIDPFVYSLMVAYTF